MLHASKSLRHILAQQRTAGCTKVRGAPPCMLVTELTFQPEMSLLKSEHPENTDGSVHSARKLSSCASELGFVAHIHI